MKACGDRSAAARLRTLADRIRRTYARAQALERKFDEFMRDRRRAPSTSLELIHADDLTRKYMIAELDGDVRRGALWLDPRLNDRGRLYWAALLREALKRHDSAWLAEQVHVRGYLVAFERALRRDRAEYATRRVPWNAHTVLAEGEFNRFYIRGLCARGLTEGIDEVEIYRARPSSIPRPVSQELVRTRVRSAALLEDLRKHAFVETALGVPGGPNSGLSVRFPARPALRSPRGMRPGELGEGGRKQCV